MDAASDAAVHTVVVMSSAQVGKTETILNLIGFFIDQDPSPILVLQPTLEMAQAFSKDRLAPMIRDTPALHGRVKDPRSRDSGNTMLHKTFPGGHITMAGANSAASLASRPIRVVLADEVDRYPVSAGTEGDPVSLARKRTTTFWNRKLVLTSTPTVKGSRIERAFNESDQRRFHVPCPDCDHAQVLRWSQVRWPEGAPAAAEYCCEACGVLWSDATRWDAVKRGAWVAEGEFRGIAGFHLSELCSPWVRLSDMVQQFLDARADPERLRAWVNTTLGESWEETGETVDATGLRRHIENYDQTTLPGFVEVVTAGVDVQDDRLEVEVVGWGADDRSAGVEYEVIYGDPGQPVVWAALDEVLLRTYRREDGASVRIAAASVDSGGHFTEAVYRFCRDRFRRRVYAIKGAGGARPVWPKLASKARTRDQFWTIGVDTAKETIYARLRIPPPPPGEPVPPGYCALPPSYHDEWFDQVTAEQRMTRFREGRPYTVWTLPKGKRNEALDCRVYAFAALKSLPPLRARPMPGAAPVAQAPRRSRFARSSYLRD